jgi:serine/threonine-protein kinase RsbW
MATPLVLRLEAATLADLVQIRRFVLDGAELLGAPQQAAEDLVIAIDEAATNVIRYGYRGRPGRVEVAIHRDDEGIVLRLSDDAPAFDPTVWPEPRLDLDLGNRPFGGMGIHLMRTAVDRLAHAARGRAGNDLTFFKVLMPQERSVPG